MLIGGKTKTILSGHDTQDRAMAWRHMVPFTYAVVSGCFLALFVPQLCTDAGDVNPHMCSLKENLSDLSTLNKVVLAVNATTAGVLLLSQYMLILRREHWLIRCLDYNKAKPYDSLTSGEFEAERPVLYEQLMVRPRARRARAATARAPTARRRRAAQRWNWLCAMSSLVALVLLVTNLVLSSVLVMKYFYLNEHTPMTLAVNTLLVIKFVREAHERCWKSWRKKLGISATLSSAKYYNVVDVQLERRIRKSTSKDALRAQREAVEGGTDCASGAKECFAALAIALCTEALAAGAE